MAGKKIYIRKCKVKDCTEHIDKVLTGMCETHSLELEARVEIQRKLAAKKHKEVRL